MKKEDRKWTKFIRDFPLNFHRAFSAGATYEQYFRFLVLTLVTIQISPALYWELKTCNSTDIGIPEECVASAFLVEDAASLKMEASDSSEIFYACTSLHGDSSQKTGIFIIFIYIRQDQANIILSLKSLISDWQSAKKIFVSVGSSKCAFQIFAICARTEFGVSNRAGTISLESYFLKEWSCFRWSEAEYSVLELKISGLGNYTWHKLIFIGWK